VIRALLRKIRAQNQSRIQICVHGIAHKLNTYSKRESLSWSRRLLLAKEMRQNVRTNLWWFFGVHGRIFRKRLQNERGDKIYHNEQKHFSRTPFAAEKKPPLRILLPKICFKNYLSLTQCANKRPRNQRYRSTRQRRASILRIDTGSWLTSCLLYRLTRRIRRGETRRVLAEKRRS